jgi:5-methylcytosine-specific restriction endonuclease McrA
VDGAVLVLNQNYEPLNVCNIKRALVLIIGGKAEILEEEAAREVRTPSHIYSMPSVIRLHSLVKRPRPVVKLTRREIFLRDNYTCQYCGVQTRDLTIDHVVPKSRGGTHTWENLVSACRACNHRKGGRLMSETRMTLRRAPFQPRAGRYYSIQRRLERSPNQEWGKFIPGFEAMTAD